jgi:hypothetical protein
MMGIVAAETDEWNVFCLFCWLEQVPPEVEAQVKQ